MAFGVDDALYAAAAAISLTDTIVKTVQSYEDSGRSLDIRRLISEVRTTALKQIDDADLALAQLERLLVEKGIDLNQTLRDVIANTPWWNAPEQYRLRRIREGFNKLADATYSATDDVAALVRCSKQTGSMGEAVLASTEAKHALFSRLLAAESVKKAIDLLRAELARHKELLS